MFNLTNITTNVRCYSMYMKQLIIHSSAKPVVATAAENTKCNTYIHKGQPFVIRCQFYLHVYSLVCQDL